VGVLVLYFCFRQIINASYALVVALRDCLAQIRNFSPVLQLKLNEYLESGRSLENLPTVDL
jgi:hypothetical protein